MKKLCFAALPLALFAFASTVNADITIGFNAGNLANSTGMTLVPVGGFLELVADTSRNGFSTPTSSAFIPGGSDDVVIQSFSLNGNLNGAGTTGNTLVYTPGNFAGLDAGDPLIFRWFPTLTAASTSPGLNTMYGEFRTTTNQDGSNLTTPWTEPADNGTYTLNFITSTLGGANPEAAGYAGLTVTPAVPEPSTWVMAGIGVVGFAIVAKRRNGTSTQ